MRCGLILFNCLILSCALFAQDKSCNLSLSGTVVCANDGKPLSFAALGFLNTNQSATTDENGKFKVQHVCPGTFHLEASAIGYRKLDTILNMVSDRTIALKMQSDTIHLEEVHITGNKVEKQGVETVTKDELSGEKLNQTRGENLGDALKEISGVDVIQTGATITKPVIHGLYSNRILILNNGVRQEGQQWGSDHAPEIDPFIATKLSVIKGAASIRYGSDAIGGVVLVEPADMPKLKSLGGEMNLVGMDNNRLYAGSGILQGAFDKKLTGLSFRIQGTYRQAGNIETPHYILDNTGLLEKNYSGELSYEKGHNGMSIYYSQFYTQLGIFTYSEASNGAQLLQLFSQPEPTNFPLSYYLKNGFYTINRGYQLVNHDLLKVNAFTKYSRLGKLSATFARQTDARQEYDLDVPYSVNGSLDNAPQNNFDLTTHTGELIWEHNSWHNISGSVGASFFTMGNVYTGLTYGPLIPNFRNYSGGLYIIEKWNLMNKLTIEGGLRYDYQWQREYLLNLNTLIEFTPTQQYESPIATIGAIYRFTPKISLNANIGNGWRAPSVYELYAFGIHGATQTFEVGDSTLKVEKSTNFTTSVHYAGEKIEGEVGVYANVIDNYIYLKPTLTYRQTIDGYYPQFDFTQTNALFKGADLDVKYHITKQLTYEPKITLVFANDLTNHSYLILIPPQRIKNTLEYRWAKLGKLKNAFASISNLIVPRQTRVPPNSDFVSPPKGYTIFSAAVGCTIKYKKQDITISLQGSNLLNTVYRDYMDFFRYYADEPGRSIQLKIRIPFDIIPNKNIQELND